MKKKEFIDNLYQKRSSYNDQDQAEMAASLLNTISTDIYSESQRFIFELIQNADDSARNSENEVLFEFKDNCMIICHNGQPFSEEDIRSLTNAGASTKKIDPSKTGYKGIGFKSVFGKSERVTILSDGYQFRFDKSYHKSILPWQVIPIWTEIVDLTEEIRLTIAKITYSVVTILEIRDTASLQTDLEELLNNGQILLFLRSVSKISVSIQGGIQYTIERKIIRSERAFNEILLSKNNSPISSWITKRFESIAVPELIKSALKNEDDKNPEKLRAAEFTELSFAARIQDQKIKALKKEDRLIFTYLPTKVSDFDFPFLVNGSFITNASREGLHEDRVWNRWLFELVAEKIFDWLVLLASSQFKLQVLHLMPNKFSSLQNELKKSFDKGFVVHSASKPYIVTTNGILKTSSELVLDKTGISNQKFIYSISIVEYLKHEKSLSFSDDCFVSNDLEVASRLSDIGIQVFGLENFEPFFTSSYFTKRHLLEDNFLLIKYFKDRAESDKEGLWYQALKKLSFIYDEKLILQNPSDGVCFPVGVNTTELGEIPVMHATVFAKIQADSFVYEWLKKLGVKEPSEITYVTNVIIPNLKRNDFIDSANFLHITHYLFRLHKSNQLTEEMLESLRELRLKLKLTETAFREAQNCYLSNRYSPQLRLEGVVNDIFFVSEEYFSRGGTEAEWHIFFKAIRVKDRIEIETINNNNTLPTLRKLTSPLWVDQCAAIAEESNPNGFGFGNHNIIRDIKIPSFLNIISSSYDYAKLFWKNIVERNISLAVLIEQAVYKYGKGYGENRFSHPVTNYFPWFIANENCIPCTTKEILKPNLVFINGKEIRQLAGEHLPVFDLDISLPEEWKKFIPLKSKLELADYLLILEKIAEKYETDSKASTVKKVTSIYSKLSSLIPDLADIDKKTITDWATKNKLLANNGKFESADQLKWVTIEGFGSETGPLKIIAFSDNKEKNSSTFRELLTLLQIQVIDEFIPTIETPSLDRSLKNRLQVILPYYAALIETTETKDNSEFERLYSLISTLSFFSASDIRLSFTNDGKMVKGPSLPVFKQDGNVYFKGRWKSERILLSLIRELSTVFEVTGFNEELRFLLLETDEHEIKEWLVEQGVETKSIPLVKTFPNVLFDAVETETSAGNILIHDIEPTADNPPSSTSPIKAFIPDVPVFKVSASAGLPPRKTVEKSEIEVQYEEIENSDDRLAIGRWSEHFVFENLADWGNYTQIVWENESEESGKPYDFKALKDGVEKFIEVKGTPSAGKELIYLSPNEWNLMFEQGIDYILIRIYNAGKTTVFEDIRDNPSEEIQKGLIRVALKL